MPRPASGDLKSDKKEAISLTGDLILLAELPKVLADQSRPAEVRSAALKAIYDPNPGKHPELLVMVKAGELADDLKQTASDLLMLSRDPKVREEAQSLFASGKGEFPEVAELVKRTGDVKNGRKLFATKTCTVCHQAGEVGINFGPGLSEIGEKLNKEALYQSLMYPGLHRLMTPEELVDLVEYLSSLKKAAPGKG
jgi:cytochrome c2